MAIVEINNVTKVYPERMGARAILGRGGLESWLTGKKEGVFKALDDISLSVEPGESLGIIGRNGSGKSTLLKILAGVTLPSSGSVTLTGRIASLLELGAGFHPMLTGRENVYLNADLLGMHPKDVDKVFDQILEFSGIGEFVDQPVDTYSSGMYVRIAFSVAVHANPDIFLVDEVLAVGDEEFQRACRKKIAELKEQGKTIIFVSHDLGIVNTLCDRVVLLNKGQMLSRGDTQSTINYYLRQVGLEKGIHTLQNDRYETVFSNGRMSLFRDREEITAPEGIKMMAQAFGQQQDSTAAEWRITNATSTSCTVEGVMTRIPLRHEWTLKLDGAKLQWTAKIHNDTEIPLEFIAAWFFLPSQYTEYMQGTREGTFHAIQPGDMTWSHIANLEARSGTVLFHGDTPEKKILQLELNEIAPQFNLELNNSDYMTGARIAGLIKRLPAEAAQLPAGSHDLFSLTIDLEEPEQSLEELRKAAQAEQSLNIQDTTLSFHRGEFQIKDHEKILSHSVHLHTQILVDGLWCMSQSLLWGPVHRDGHTLRVSGDSLRFPITEHWTLTKTEKAFALEVCLEAHKEFDAMEYNISLGLNAEYTQWAFTENKGLFPAFIEGDDTWRHINERYEKTDTIQTSGPGLPTMIMKVNHPKDGMHMTAINTGDAQHARVLQAIYTPEQSGNLHFSPGTHTLFSGELRLEKPCDE